MERYHYRPGQLNVTYKTVEEGMRALSIQKGKMNIHSIMNKFNLRMRNCNDEKSRSEYILAKNVLSAKLLEMQARKKNNKNLEVYIPEKDKHVCIDCMGRGFFPNWENIFVKQACPDCTETGTNKEGVKHSYCGKCSYNKIMKFWVPGYIEEPCKICYNNSGYYVFVKSSRRNEDIKCPTCKGTKQHTVNTGFRLGSIKICSKCGGFGTLQQTIRKHPETLKFETTIGDIVNKAYGLEKTE